MNPLVINNNQEIDSPIIVALDYDNEKDVMNFVSKVSPSLCKLKVGKELFTACGPKLVEKLVISGYKVFLDLKFHDIPNTVQNACRVASNLGVWMINIHAIGGFKMMEMAKSGVEQANHKALLIAVTTLTSMNQEDLNQVDISTNINDHILNLAKLAHSAGLDGVVCSAFEASLIKDKIRKYFLTVSPGIRLTKELNDDQKRIMTPNEALDNLVDYMVIGRPITKAPDPFIQLQEILSSIYQKA